VPALQVWIQGRAAAGRVTLTTSGAAKTSGQRKRFKGDFVCPVCKGTEDEDRGQGTRCFGYLSGGSIVCTREDHANQAPFVPTANGYRHNAKGPCPCGKEHAPSDRKKMGTMDHVYKYRDASGNVVFETVRFKNPKDFRQRRPSSNGKPIWNLNGVTTILYQLPELLTADPTRTVWIVEGEKDVDRLRLLGEVATCNPMGAGKWFEHYADPLRDRICRIIEDSDEPGRQHAQKIARSLRGKALSVAIVELPGLPDKGDASDFLNAGGTIEQLIALGKAAPEWEPSMGVPEPSGNGVGHDDKRPRILITTDEKSVNDQAVSALAGDPALYRLGYVLATILQEGEAPRGIEYKDGPPPQISPIEPATLRERMAQTAKWQVTKARASQFEIIAAHPPDWSVHAVYRRGIWPGVPPIVGVIEAPTIRRDGSILSKPGYDEATRLYLRPKVTLKPIPDRPSKQDAEQARDLIFDLVSDFPFKDKDDKDKKQIHRAAWLAAFLTVLGRPSFDGPAPLSAIDGNTPGSGKTKLVDLIAITASGRRMPRSVFPSGRHADEEVRKRITSLALAGERFTLLDNVDSPLGGAPLDAALTSDTWKDRPLGSSTMTAELPLQMVWFASGNNLQYRGDFVRRVLPCRLESPLEDPETRTGFKYPDLLGHVLANRAAILRAAMVILRAYHAAGCPKLVSPLGSFEGWSRAIADPVMWVTGVNPLDVRAEIKANDRDSQLRVALVYGWSELTGSDVGLTVAAALKMLRDDKTELLYTGLRAALAELSEKGDIPSAKSVGRILKSCDGRNLGAYSVKGVENRKGIYSWKVVQAKLPSSAGFAGYAGFVASTTHAPARAPALAHTQWATNPANPANPAPEIDPYSDDWTKRP
jgi:putative DNA primase/helicase